MMRGENALQPQLVKLMQTHVSADNPGYGLGTSFRQNLGYGHSGAIVGYLSYMAYDPTTEVSVVAMLPLMDWRGGETSLNMCIGALFDATYGARAPFWGIRVSPEKDETVGVRAGALKGSLLPDTEIRLKTGTIGLTTSDVDVITLPGDAGP